MEFLKLLFFLCFLALFSCSLSQSPAGFISIDCGLEGDSNYTDDVNGIVYSPDAGFVDGGINFNVPPRDAFSNFARRYFTMRRFPDGRRNCYTAGPVSEGGKYLIRAGFLYGNYDGKNQTPSFDLHLGGNFWQTVVTESEDNVFAEIIAISPADKVQVCLVNTGAGIPFISSLEVRPLLNLMYPIVNASQFLVLSFKRVNYGGTQILRYPTDPFDRFWYGTRNRTGWTTATGTGNITRVLGETSLVPDAILKVATVAYNLDFNVTVNPGEKIYAFLYFAEVQRLEWNETREFDVLFNGKMWFKQYRPTYMTAGMLSTSRSGTDTTATFSFNATGNSTLPPMINAREVYGLRELESLPTDSGDVNTISKIKDLYKLKKNWQGDPCVPKNLSWEGVACFYDDSMNPRIVSLNLSHGKLLGEISPIIADLKALTSLDLSDNNLTGEIPSKLGNLPRLKVLVLKNNQLNGSIPDVLYQRAQNGLLMLSIEGNANIHGEIGSSSLTKKNPKKKKNYAPIIAGISAGAIIILGIIAIVLWRLRRKENSIPRTPGIAIENYRDDVALRARRKQKDLESESNEFSFQEIVKITKNFERMIGRGGFGIVYYGSLNDGMEIAVKMISRTSRGAKEFQAEAQILTRVHHKNLVSLLGYCDDKNNLALVYEYMPKGSLADHISRDQDNVTGLNWLMRLKIALDVAQGLDYLHSFCKPSVIHRDVKTRNILLTKNFEAKLGDFGLSKLFFTENATHISTTVVGTPGYLDPEYYQTYRLNEKSDVYSFGIVLFEIVTGLPPTSHDPQGGPILPWLKSRLERGDISSIVDRNLRGNYDLNSMWKVVEIAMACSAPTSGQRPTMSEVVQHLKECLEFVASKDNSRSFSSQISNSNGTLPNGFDLSMTPSARA